MNLYRYLWEDGIWYIHADDIEDAKQFVFDMDRIPYDIIQIDYVDMEVSDEEEIKTIKSKQSVAVVSQTNASEAVRNEAIGIKRMVI
jgi:hypothetical protein